MDKSSPGTDFRFNAPESEGSALIKTSNYPGHSIICGNLRRRRRSRLQKSSCPFKTGHPERWPSGLRRTLGKRVCGKPYRGFESHSLRQQLIDIAERIVMSSICATFPTVSVSIRENSKLRARITPDSSD